MLFENLEPFSKEAITTYKFLTSLYGSFFFFPTNLVPKEEQRNLVLKSEEGPYSIKSTQCPSL